MTIAPITTPVLPPVVNDHSPLDPSALAELAKFDSAPSSPFTSEPAVGNKEDAPPAVGKLVAAVVATLYDGNDVATDVMPVSTRSEAVATGTVEGAPAAIVLANELLDASINAWLSPASLAAVAELAALGAESKALLVTVGIDAPVSVAATVGTTLCVVGTVAVTSP